MVRVLNTFMGASRYRIVEVCTDGAARQRVAADNEVDPVAKPQRQPRLREGAVLQRRRAVDDAVPKLPSRAVNERNRHGADARLRRPGYVEPVQGAVDAGADDGVCAVGDVLSGNADLLLLATGLDRDRRGDAVQNLRNGDIAHR